MGFQVSGESKAPLQPPQFRRLSDRTDVLLLFSKAAARA